MPIRFAIIAVLLGACVDESEPELPVGDEFVVDESKEDSSNQPCGSIGPFAQLVVNELGGLWRTQPSYICAYRSALAASNTRACPMIANNAGYCRLDGAIGWHTPFLSKLYSTHGTFAPIVVMAHEWGHMNQHRLGLFNANRTTKQNELNADCQAGIFVAWHQMIWGQYDIGPAVQSWNTMCAIGDPIHTWWDPTMHGTCAQRGAAFSHGYQWAFTQARNLAVNPHGTSLAICGIF